jgi:hypothetical protein
MFVAGEHCDLDTLHWIRKVLNGRPILGAFLLIKLFK